MIVNYAPDVTIASQGRDVINDLVVVVSREMAVDRCSILIGNAR